MRAADRRENDEAKRDMRIAAIGVAFGFGGSDGINTLDRSLRDG